MTDECVHRCDGAWINTPTGLMPCPRHALDTHESWAARLRRTGPPVTPPPPADPDTTTAGLAAARAALTRKQDPPA